MLPPFAVTPLYAALCGILLVMLSLRVIGYRRSRRVSIGDGGHNDLARAIRAQANLVEYAPLTLLLLFMLELSRQPPFWALHLLGAALFLGRVLHAWGLLTPKPHFGRVAGMGLTITALLVSAVWLLAVVLMRMTG